jgi:FkbM family methyltransferase
MLHSFDPEVTTVLAAASTTNEEVVWDIGANKGACSYALAAALPHAKIVGIEPQSRLAPLLLHNLEQICPGRFEFYPVGISITEGAATLTIPGGNTGSGTLHGERLGVSGRTEEIQLTTATLLASMSSFGWPTLAKIDVEGHEATVIESLAPALRSHICKTIVFESHATEGAEFMSIPEAVTPLGYQLFGIRKTPFSTRLTPTESQLPGVTDYAIVHRSVVEQNRKLAALVR